MSPAVAQGRLKGLKPVAVIDIGSNSIRVVVYEGIVRSPTVLFNEKLLCGLGKGLAKTGKLNEKSVDIALRALKRFRVLAEQAGAVSIHALATAAAREAKNGPDFISQAEAILGRHIEVLTGKEEAYYSALGIISGFYKPQGVTGDLGGGSLELVGVNDHEVGEGITLPLGGLRLQDMSNEQLPEAAKIARTELARATLLEEHQGQVFYAVGGTWRNLAKLHMTAKHYPLHVMHGYEMDPVEAKSFLTRVAKGNIDTMRGIEAVSKNRRQLLGYGAAVLLETIRRMKPSKIVFSALGVREGYLYSLLPKNEQRLDPLLSSAEELAILRSRSPRHARELATWTTLSLPILGFDETEDEGRYRQAACLVADISWRAHPDYRGSQALNIIAHGSFGGIDHPGRSFMALANYYRHEGLVEDEIAPEILQLATPRLRARAKLLGALLRVIYLLSASMPGVIPRLYWREEENGVALVVPGDIADLISDRPEGRLQQLAKLTGKNLFFAIGDSAIDANERH
ncbi:MULTISPECIES: exopolyphosphatase [Brucella/Ochrobactrum group]|uniref:exopolyphosphatase n=1 Tax=Brucella/Ochrobactrum group TaxID=2826938 RepID=UPI0016552BB8|nr:MULTISPECIES: exopolyphosphatase [Brucella/Ochrobactrum group]MBC8717704.1 exopolyphosphatase [Ochrobactrum sp. Marseille-Q0166]